MVARDERAQELRKALSRYFDLVGLLATTSLKDPNREYMLPLGSWADSTFGALTQSTLVDGVAEAMLAQWTPQSDEVPVSPDPVDLMIMELHGISDAIQSTEHYSEWKGEPERLVGAAKAARTRRQKKRQKDVLNAGGTTLGSIIDAVGDFSPILKGLLKSGKEVIDIARG